MSFSNPFALDQLLDLEIGMATNGYGASAGSNNPSSLSYSPESSATRVFAAGGMYNPAAAARGITANGGSAANGLFHLNHSSAASGQNHHSLLTASSHNHPDSFAGPAGAYGTNHSVGGNAGLFHLNHPSAASAGQSHHSLYSPSINTSNSASAVAAANTALQQMAAFDPTPMRQQGMTTPSRQQQQHTHRQNDFGSPLEELLMLGTSSFMNPSSASNNLSGSSFDQFAMQHDAYFERNCLTSRAQTREQHEEEEEYEQWMKDLNLQVPSLSLEPITGVEIIRRIKSCSADVLKRYIPCVDFLVQCQQDLRKGLAAAQPKQTNRRYRQSSMSPKQFWQSYIDILPNRFYLTNERRMESSALHEAVEGLQKLRNDAKQAVNQGCEAVKNSFLGGMKEGESWGLRKWLSKNGNALKVCTDLECILKACKELDKSKDSTKKLAAVLRPIAKQTLDRLKKDVPPSYQERSTAHPYLPFFHRLEGALRNMSQFDPEDDGVICLDDSDDEDDVQVIVEPPPQRKPTARKRKAEAQVVIDATTPSQKRVFKEEKIAADDEYQEDHQEYDIFAAAAAITATTTTTTTVADDGSSSGESEVDSVIEIIAAAENAADDVEASHQRKNMERSEWRCTNCSLRNPSSSLGVCQGCGEPSYNSDLVGTLFSPSFDDKFPDGLDFDSVDRDIGDFVSENRSKSKKSSKRSTESNYISHRFPVQACAEEMGAAIEVAQSLASKAERLAIFFENPDSVHPTELRRARKHHNLWDDLYGTALRIFSDVLRQPDAVHFIESVSQYELMKAGLPEYEAIIKNPLCFHEILATLIDLDQMGDDPSRYQWFNGVLPRRGLSQWNMWRGADLLQAVDLVFLNSLAYGKYCGEGRSKHRSRTNDLRKQFWSRINELVSSYVSDPEERRHSTPTRRSETSGFVVLKSKGR